MDVIKNKPVLIYDDMCSSCTIFAKHAFNYSRGQIDCIGHYSEDGQKFRKLIFPRNFNEIEMFWIITANHAYGGRSGLLPLLGLILKGFVMSFISPGLSPNRIFPGYCLDNAMCNSKKFKIKRIYNLLRRGKKLKVKYVKSIKR